MGGDDVEQLAGEEGVDGLAVALGEALQGQDLEAGMRTSRPARRRSSGMAPPRAASTVSWDQKLIPKSASSPQESLTPSIVSTPYSSPTSIQPRTSSSGIARNSAASARGAALGLHGGVNEEAAVRLTFY